eukprot:6984635-Prymnesium_polylepis.1
MRPPFSAAGFPHGICPRRRRSTPLRSSARSAEMKHEWLVNIRSSRQGVAGKWDKHERLVTSETGARGSIIAGA